MLELRGTSAERVGGRRQCLALAAGADEHDGARHLESRPGSQADPSEVVGDGIVEGPGSGLGIDEPAAPLERCSAHTVVRLLADGVTSVRGTTRFAAVSVSLRLRSRGRPDRRSGRARDVVAEPTEDVLDEAGDL
ncbi:hypothetical protein GCM10009797_27910 [Nocardioides hwasunensis]